MPDWNSEFNLNDVPCPLCDSDKRRRIVDTVWDAPESAVYQCKACEIVFIHPIMSVDEEKAFYEAEFSRYMKQRGAAGETVPDDHFNQNRNEAERRVASLRPYLREGMTILEIGSSTGFMLARLRSEGARVTGIEPNLLYAEYARNLGIETLAHLSEVGGRSYDMILAYYVLEHLRDPLGYLRKLRTMLNPGGIAAFEVPNVDDALVSFYQLADFDRFYWQKAHYFYYSHRTLSHLLEQAGFTDIETIPEHRYDFSNHVHWLLRGQPGGKGKYVSIFDDRLTQEYSRCLKNHWLCDTVFATVRAKSAPDG